MLLAVLFLTLKIKIEKAKEMIEMIKKANLLLSRAEPVRLRDCAA